MPESVQLDEGTARVGSIVALTDKAKQFRISSTRLKPPIRVVEIKNDASNENPYFLLVLQGSDGKQHKGVHPSWLKEAD